MSENNTVPKSLVEQVIEDMLGRLAQNSNFESNILERIQKLIDVGELSKHESVTAALTTKWSMNDENS